MLNFINQAGSRLFYKESVLLDRFATFFHQERIPLEIVDTRGKRYFKKEHFTKYRLEIKDNRFFNALVLPDAFSLGEAYIRGYFDIIGNIRELYELMCQSMLLTDRKRSFLKRVAQAFINPLKQEKQNVEYHYNIPARFYKLFIGKTMGYTCGYYLNETTSMDCAQTEKMDIICRKLRLKTGDRLLDIGCGWGNFIIHAAKRYGIKTTGITLSREQKAYADQWIMDEGLKTRCRVRIMNYRQIKSLSFNKISCIGMSEHVGKKNMEQFFDTVFQCISPGGLFLQHTITTNEKKKKGYENSFLNKYMFPGGELLFQHKLAQYASGAGFELLSTENFRPHYVRTLHDWIRNMEQNREALLLLASEELFRIFHIFFIGSLVSFKNAEMSLMQNLFYKPGNKGCSIDYFTTPYAVHSDGIS